MKLQVNEIFGPTIQGEGRSAGKDVLFLRLSLCNLACDWCDSKYTWDWKNYDRKKEIHPTEFEDIIKELEKRNLKSLVITGGEPLIQYKSLAKFLDLLKDWWIEIETNGTLYSEEVFEKVNQINCSPKLNNSLNKREVRLTDALPKIAKLEKATFKFVVSKEEDILEIEEIVKSNNINPKNVFLMPLGLSREELEKTQDLTEQLALKMGFNFQNRLHILKWGTRRGV